jgi:hypothetical protein
MLDSKKEVEKDKGCFQIGCVQSGFFKMGYFKIGGLQIGCFQIGCLQIGCLQKGCFQIVYLIKLAFQNLKPAFGNTLKIIQVFFLLYYAMLNLDKNVPIISSVFIILMPIILLPFLLSMLILNLNSRYNLWENESNKTVYIAKKD